MRKLLAKVIVFLAEKYSLWGVIGHLRPVGDKKKKPLTQFVKTTDTYEATFYLMHHARLARAYKRRIPENKRKKLGRPFTWVMLLKDVPLKAIMEWKTNVATCPVRQFATERKKLKKVFQKGWK